LLQAVQGCGPVFQTSARLANSKEFPLAKSENSAESCEEESMREEKNTRQVGELVFVFIEFHSHLASWRVVQSAPL
jgi:hypothetical protein